MSHCMHVPNFYKITKCGHNQKSKKKYCFRIRKFIYLMVEINFFFLWHLPFISIKIQKFKKKTYYCVIFSILNIVFFIILIYFSKSFFFLFFLFNLKFFLFPLLFFFFLNS